MPEVKQIWFHHQLPPFRVPPLPPAPHLPCFRHTGPFTRPLLPKWHLLAVPSWECWDFWSHPWICHFLWLHHPHPSSTARTPITTLCLRHVLLHRTVDQDAPQAPPSQASPEHLRPSLWLSQEDLPVFSTPVRPMTVTHLPLFGSCRMDNMGGIHCPPHLLDIQVLHPLLPLPSVMVGGPTSPTATLQNGGPLWWMTYPH
jgi:hypothetical protein